MMTPIYAKSCSILVANTLRKKAAKERTPPNMTNGRDPNLDAAPAANGAVE